MPRKAIVFSLVVLFIVSLVPQQGSAQTPVATPIFEPDMNLVITFVNYDQALVNDTLLEASLPQKIQKNYDFATSLGIEYSMTYQILFTDSTFEDPFNSFIDSVSTPDWTSDLNETALRNQVNNFGRAKIFTQKQGIAIDARATEQWLAQNLPDSSIPNRNKFYLFVLNLSRLDSGDQDHWFNITEVDPDSGRARFYWRLEWDYPLNYDVKFPYAAFTERTDIAFIDLTAFQWYLKWRAIWNEDTQAHPSYFNDLDHLLMNASTVDEKRDIVTDTASVWLTDWIRNIFNMQKGPVFKYPTLGDSLGIQLQVFYNSSESDFTASDLSWIVNTQLTKDIFENTLQSEQVQVIANFADIENDPWMALNLERSRLNYTQVHGISPPFENWTFYSGFSLFDKAMSEPERYFDLNLGNNQVFGIIFLLDNASFSDGGIPWAGKLYTGLGGGGQILILYELDRAFMPDRQSHKAGLSKVLIHEIGHAIGFPHTFISTFTSDFASDVMGYYPGASNFSQLISMAYWRNLVDELITSFLNLYESMYSSWQSNSDPTTYKRLVSGFEKYNESVFKHQQRKYLEAYEAMRIAINRLKGLPDNTQTDSSDENITTTTPPYGSEDPLDTNLGNPTFLSFNPFIAILSIGTMVLIVDRRKRK